MDIVEKDHIPEDKNKKVGNLCIDIVEVQVIERIENVRIHKNKVQIIINQDKVLVVENVDEALKNYEGDLKDIKKDKEKSKVYKKVLGTRIGICVDVHDEN